MNPLLLFHSVFSRLQDDNMRLHPAETRRHNGLQDCVSKVKKQSASGLGGVSTVIDMDRRVQSVIGQDFVLIVLK